MQLNGKPVNSDGSIFNSQTRKRVRMNGADSISPAAYNLTIGLVILYGFVANALIVWLGSDFFTSLAGNSIIIFLIGYLVSCIVGTVISFKSNNPVISFVGYNLVVVPVGAVLSVYLPAYNIADILLAIITTGAVVLIMTILGSIFPRVFAKMGRTLFISLILCLIVQYIPVLFGYTGDIFTWIFVIIFSLYIGYDWQKSQMYPKTYDNAVDCALDLYLDIINLFIRLLKIISRNRNNNRF